MKGKHNRLFSVIALMIAMTVIGAGSAFALVSGPYYWVGVADDNDFNNFTNWCNNSGGDGFSPGAFIDDDVFIFNDLVPGALNLTTVAINTRIIIKVTDQTGLVTITPGGIVELGGIDMSGATGAGAALTIASGAGSLLLSAPTAITGMAGKAVSIAESIDQNGFLITIDGDGTDEISGALSGAGGLTYAGTGSITLSGNNSATGAYTLSSGTIESKNAEAINAGSALNLNGGTLIITTAILANKWPTAISIGGGSPTIQCDASSVCNVVIAAGGNSYLITGTSTLELTAANTGSGTITLDANAVTLKLSAASAATGPLTLSAGTLEANNATALDTYSTLTLIDGILKITTGIASGAWPDAIAIGASETPEIQVNAASVCDVAITNGANNFYITGSDNFTIQAGVLGGGAGTVTITMTAATDVVKFTTVNNTFTGLCTVNGGTVIFNNTNASAVTVGAAGVIGGTGTITGAIIVNGRVKPGDAGVGTLTASGNVTFNPGSYLTVNNVNAAKDVLAVGGTLSLQSNNTAFITLEAGESYSASNKVVTAVTYDITNKFKTTSLPPNWSITQTVNSGVWLTYTNPNPIPTLNTWGIMIMLLLLASTGILVMRGRQQTAHID